MLGKSYDMKMDKKLLELYSDYILSSFERITATGLSKVLLGIISHDVNYIYSKLRNISEVNNIIICSISKFIL